MLYSRPLTRLTSVNGVLICNESPHLGDSGDGVLALEPLEKELLFIDDARPLANHAIHL